MNDTGVIDGKDDLAAARLDAEKSALAKVGELKLPPGWTMQRVGPLLLLVHHTASKLLVTMARETYTDPQQAPLNRPGVYLRYVFSRKDRDPTWIEMRDFLWNDAPWGTPGRDWFMLCVPTAQHVNIHDHAFHWWQVVE